MNLRHYAGQDCDIVSIVKPITKYAYEIKTIQEIPEILYNCMYNLINGRPGPVWLSVPIDIQGYFMDNCNIPKLEKHILVETTLLDDLNNINNLLQSAKRPIILAGNGIKLGCCSEKFKEFN